jgi:hypothetical protein
MMDSCYKLSILQIALQEDFGGIPRMILKFSTEDLNALTLLPTILQQFVSNILLKSSQLQILTADNEEVYQKVVEYLERYPGAFRGGQKIDPNCPYIKDSLFLH